MLRHRLKLVLCSISILLVNSLVAKQYSVQYESELLRKADSLSTAREFISAISHFDELLQNGKTDSVKAQAYYGKGYASFSISKIPQAIEHIKRSILTYSLFLEATDFKTIRPYAMLGYLYRYFETNERLALKYYKLELKSILANIDKVNSSSKFYNAYNLATTYRLIEDYELGLNYGFRALRIAQEDENDQFLELSHSVIANIYNASEQNQEAIIHYKKKINITSKLGGDKSPVLTKDYDNLGLALLDETHYDEALFYFNKSLQISKSLNKADQAYTLMLIGDLFGRKGDLIKAKSTLRQSIALDNDITTNSLAYRFLGLTYQKERKYDSAQFFYRESVATKVSVQSRSLLEINLEQLKAIPSLFQTLNLSARCYLDQYKVAHDLSALKNANLMYQRIDSIAATKRNLFSTQEARLFFQNSAHSLYESALETSYQMQEEGDCGTCIESSWHYMEVNRSLSLQALINQAQFYEDLGIPDSLQRVEQGFHQKESLLRSQIVDCELNESCNEGQVIELRNQWLQNEHLYNNLLKDLKNSFPKYYAINYSTQPISLLAFQKQMNDELLVSFFQGEHHIYWLVVGKDIKRFGRIEFNKTLKEELGNFLAETSGQTLSQKSLQKAFDGFHQSAFKLYELLLKPLLEQTASKKLIIIPDGVLNEISFEALITSLNDKKRGINFKDLDYLINSYQVDYALSANLLHQNKQASSLKKAKVLAFGNPVGQDSKVLMGTKAELESIQTIVSSANLYSGNEAIKSTFQSVAQSGGFDILHLALHGMSNQQNSLNSKLIFSYNIEQPEDTALHLYELYALNLSARLVVLSACETGVGKWSRGEGTLSLARGFAYNSNPNIITSLWKLNDKGSSEVVSEFYKNLTVEMTIGESLRNAKLNSIQNADELTAHPSNWAALVHLGNPDLRILPAKRMIGIQQMFLILISMAFLFLIGYHIKKGLSVRKSLYSHNR